MAQTLNGITCAGSRMLSKDSVEFSLMNTTVEAAAALDGETLEVKEGDALIASYAGFKVVEVALATDGTSVRLTASRDLPTETKEAIRALESNMQVVTTTANSAVSTAAEAKTIAEQAGTDPQLQALATVQVATMDLSGATSDEVIAFRDYWPEWAAGVAYKHNQPLRYNGKYYRVSKDLTSQAIYPPGTAESEYYEVELAPDGIIIFKKPGGDYNKIIKGELRHYPDADGPVYRAKENTTYSPEEYPAHWEQVNA